MTLKQTAFIDRFEEKNSISVEVSDDNKRVIFSDENDTLAAFSRTGKHISGWRNCEARLVREFCHGYWHLSVLGGLGNDNET